MKLERGIPCHDTIGRVFGMHCAIIGAIFSVMIDPFLTVLKEDVP